MSSRHLPDGDQTLLSVRNFVGHGFLVENFEMSALAHLVGSGGKNHAHRLRRSAFLANHLADVFGSDFELNRRAATAVHFLHVNLVGLVDKRSRHQADEIDELRSHA